MRKRCFRRFPAAQRFSLLQRDDGIPPSNYEGGAPEKARPGRMRFAAQRKPELRKAPGPPQIGAPWATKARRAGSRAKKKGPATTTGPTV
jgi:hypothetical protein